MLLQEGALALEIAEPVGHGGIAKDPQAGGAILL
jgi:hypothetical protein